MGGWVPSVLVIMTSFSLVTVTLLGAVAIHGVLTTPANHRHQDHDDAAALEPAVPQSMAMGSNISTSVSHGKSSVEESNALNVGSHIATRSYDKRVDKAVSLAFKSPMNVSLLAGLIHYYRVCHYPVNQKGNCIFYLHYLFGK